MSELHRLRDDSRSPLVRSLLDAATDDRSAEGARDRAVLAVGVALAGVAAAGVASSTAHAASGAAGASAAGTSAAAGGSLAPAAAKGGGLLLLKWLGVVAVSTTVAAGAVHVVRTVSATGAGPNVEAAPQPKVVSPPHVGARAGESPASAASAPATTAPATPTIDVESLPAAPTTTAPSRIDGVRGTASSAASASPPSGSTPTVSSTSTVASTLPAGSITEQVAALHDARAALDAHDPARAIALLDAFDRAHPSSPLQEEVTVLRIDALVDAHELGAARSLAQAFLLGHPGSAYREHVRAKAGLSDQTPGPGH